MFINLVAPLVGWINDLMSLVWYLPGEGIGEGGFRLHLSYCPALQSFTLTKDEATAVGRDLKLLTLN